MMYLLRMNPWWSTSESSAQPPRLRLFCFPHAGGTALAYRTWQAKLATPDVEVCAIQLPGRENRLREAPVSNLEALVEALVEVMTPTIATTPYACFAHSMGTLVAFEVVHRLLGRGGPPPLGMVMSAHRAPSCPRSRPLLHSLPQPEFIAALRELGGTPEMVLNEPSLMEMVAPILRADFSLTELYQAKTLAPLRCPLTVFGSETDPRVDRHELAAWRSETTAAFDLRMFSGGHFYLKDREAEVLAAIDTRLDTWM
jgi:medium-chain acyl-[acyl-carrier-protein] hydrolase